MVVGIEDAGEVGGQEPSEQRHRGLETREGEGDDQGVPVVEAAHFHAAGERGGEGVGGHTESDQPDGPERHRQTFQGSCEN